MITIKLFPERMGPFSGRNKAVAAFERHHGKWTRKASQSYYEEKSSPNPPARYLGGNQ